MPGTGRINLADVRSSRPVRLLDHEPIDLTIDVHTRIACPALQGVPYIGTAQRVRIGARRCGGQVLVNRIAAAVVVLSVVVLLVLGLRAGRRGSPASGAG